MSLLIDVDKVEAVLLPDGWHEIKVGSLLFDAYEFVWWGDEPDYQRVAQSDQPKDCHTGFSFLTRPEEERYYGRIDAIICVRES